MRPPLSSRRPLVDAAGRWYDGAAAGIQHPEWGVGNADQAPHAALAHGASRPDCWPACVGTGRRAESSRSWGITRPRAPSAAARRRQSLRIGLVPMSTVRLRGGLTLGTPLSPTGVGGAHGHRGCPGRGLAASKATSRLPNTRSSKRCEARRSATSIHFEILAYRFVGVGHRAGSRPWSLPARARRHGCRPALGCAADRPI